MNHPILRLDPESTALVVVDVQEKLAKAMPSEEGARCVENVGRWVEAAELLSIPVLVTEQYPKGLGSTVPSVKTRLDALSQPPTPIEKLHFDATSDPGFDDRLDHLITNRGAEGAIRTLVVCGMEAHICVYQTVRGLISGGFSVHVPVDATCARRPENLMVARELWRLSGAIVTSTEAALFDMVGHAGHDKFKAISRLVR